MPEDINMLHSRALDALAKYKASPGAVEYAMFKAATWKLSRALHKNALIMQRQAQDVVKR